jgi:methionyl-tRNA synthetase
VLPEDVPANEFLNLEGQKLSTSRGWAVWAHDILARFPPDYVRYALLGVLPETKDSDFSFKDMQARVNNELADTLGNLVNRSLKFVVQYMGAVVPRLGTPSPADQEMLAAVARCPAEVSALLEQYRFRDAGAAVMSLARQANKYFNDEAPWASRKTDPERCARTLHVALQVSAALSILIEPFLPFTAARLRRMLKLENVRSSEAGGAQSGLGWHDAARPLLTDGAALGEPEILFTKVDDDAVAAELAKLGATSSEVTPNHFAANASQVTPDRSAANASQVTPTSSAASVSHAGPAPEGPYSSLAPGITYEDFAKLDLRVALVLSAERVEKSKKLLCCQLDLGFESRQVLAGVAEHLGPEDLLGKKLVLVANLAPRKMMGLASQGMLLMAKDRLGRLSPVLASGEPGSTVA